MPDADLYLTRIQLGRYLSDEECRRCGAHSCKELVEKLLDRTCQPGQLGQLDGTRQAAISTAAGLSEMLPVVPSLQHPRPVAPGVMELNDPSDGDPVLLTGNNEFTQQVLLAVLSTTASPFYLVFSDTRGDTLDMAIILESFTPQRVQRFFETRDVLSQVGGGPLVLPGLAESLAEPIASATGMSVKVGPVCAAELPLFYSEIW